MDAGDFLEVSWGGDDGDGIGRLSVAAVANGFAGRAHAWFDRATIVQFGEALSLYPLDDQPPPTISGGFGGDAPQTHVCISAYRLGSRGQVAFGVELATELWHDEPSERQHRVRLELLTTYERLRAFASELQRLPDGNGHTARIEGDRLA